MANVFKILLAIVLLAIVFNAGPLFADEAFTPQQLDHFENVVRPILAKRCHQCHANGEAEGGLSLDSRKAMLSGGDTGAAISPGDPENSLLVRALHYDDVYQMPPDSKLPDQEIKILEDWVRQSAPWPEHAGEIATAARKPFDIEARKAEHWCWQPVNPPALPETLAGTEAVDYLIEQKLAAVGLPPGGPAKRSSLLRRISFDLTGLPPTPELVQQYVLQESLTREQVIDQLLESPHFGERWARHWMDLARYAETYGHEFDYPIRDAWRYRDYLIRAFNLDLPWDQFVVEHIAGDLLESPRRHETEKFNESVLATGFWFLGEATHGPVDSKADEARRIDNQIDVMCRSFIGMTVACARCHDHKFDAISTRDYYALAGFLQSSRRQRQVIDTNLAFKKAAEKVAGLRRELAGQAERLRDLIVDWDLTEQDFAGVELPTVRSGVDLSTRDGDIEFPLDEAHWKTDGFAFQARADGIPMIVGDEIQWLPQRAISSGEGGAGFAGVAHSSTFEINRKFIHIRIKASKARVELVVDGCRMMEFNPILFRGLIHKDVNHETFRWLTIAGELSLHQGQRAWLEFQDNGDGFFAVDRIVFSSDRKPPAEPDSSLEPGEIPRQVQGEHGGEILSWILKNDLASRLGAGEIVDEIRSLGRQIAKINAKLPKPQFALAMADGFPEDEKVFIRGNHKTEGSFAPRQFLTAIVGHDQSIDRDTGSGRLHLAKQLVDPENPLTSRVFVNRVWHHLFGRGIVPSVDNFGVLGQQPSHPELLDHLAAELIEDGWSLKRLLRKLMLTRAYARRSTPTVVGQQVDPQNIYLSRANLRRLPGEAIRDSMLASGGQLDREMFGESVPIHITPFMRGRGRPKGSGPLDGHGRRSIYIETRRNFLSPMMLAFDTPIPFNAIGRRTVSNVPAQALILMNDPLVIQLSEKFARRAIREGESAQGPATDSRIEFIYRQALSRRPSEAELQQARDFIEAQANRLGAGTDSVDVWQDFCHVIFNVKEFIYLN